MKTAPTELFGELPVFDIPMPQDELRLLASLPYYGDDQCVGEIDIDDERCARRLEKKGLIKVLRQKADPVAAWPTWYAGKL